MSQTLKPLAVKERVFVSLPKGLVPYHLPTWCNALKRSLLQEKMPSTFYQIKKESNGNHYLFHIIQNQSKNISFSEHSEDSKDSEDSEITRFYNTFNFVILQHPETLTHSTETFELCIGKKNHFYIAKEMLKIIEKISDQDAVPTTVVAAGEIHTDCHGKIIKITDQSGSFYIPTTDPLLTEKRNSAKKVMKAFDFPMHLFNHFNEKSISFISKQTPLEKQIQTREIEKIESIFQKEKTHCS